MAEVSPSPVPSSPSNMVQNGMSAASGGDEMPPLGVKRPLLPHRGLGRQVGGSYVPNVQFMVPLGARSLSVLTPSIFSDNFDSGLGHDQPDFSDSSFFAESRLSTQPSSPSPRQQAPVPASLPSNPEPSQQPTSEPSGAELAIQRQAIEESVVQEGEGAIAPSPEPTPYKDPAPQAPEISPVNDIPIQPKTFDDSEDRGTSEIVPNRETTNLISDEPTITPSSNTTERLPEDSGDVPVVQRQVDKGSDVPESISSEIEPDTQDGLPAPISSSEAEASLPAQGSESLSLQRKETDLTQSSTPSPELSSATPETVGNPEASSGATDTPQPSMASQEDPALLASSVEEPPSNDLSTVQRTLDPRFDGDFDQPVVQRPVDSGERPALSVPSESP